jgi:uncharacterized protein
MDLGQIPQPQAESSGARSRADAGRAFLIRTYVWMAVGLGLSGGVAAWFSASADVATYFEDNPLVFAGLLLAELGLMVGLGLGLRRIGEQTAVFLYCLFVAINGVVLAVVFDVYSSAEIVPAFLACAGMFGAMAIYGARTQRDLRRFGPSLFMASMGVLFALLFNLFWRGGDLSWLVSFGAVALFAAMTAWTTQALESFGAEQADAETEKLAVFGALLLYLMLINMVIFVLRGGRPGGPG